MTCSRDDTFGSSSPGDQGRFAISAAASLSNATIRPSGNSPCNRKSKASCAYTIPSNVSKVPRIDSCVKLQMRWAGAVRAGVTAQDRPSLLPWTVALISIASRWVGGDKLHLSFVSFFIRHQLDFNMLIWQGAPCRGCSVQSSIRICIVRVGSDHKRRGPGVSMRRTAISLTFYNWCAVAICMAALLAGCVSPYGAPFYPASPQFGVPYGAILKPDQTIDLENSDRIARFQRLASIRGVAPPMITQIMVPPGQVPGARRAIPVVRVVFSESVLFDFNSDRSRAEATAVLDLVADNMRRDVPDAQLTLLGHTDAIGSDEYNNDLSMRRARNVFQALVNRGCSPAQLSTVAIGKNQPIAPNDTEAGRALNRRVEFLISANQIANLAVVRLQPINPAYLRVDPTDVRPVYPAADRVTVFKPVTEPYNGPADISEATPHGKVSLKPLGDIPLQGASPSPPAELVSKPSPPVLQEPAPREPPVYRQPAPVELAPLGAPHTY